MHRLISTQALVVVLFLSVGLFIQTSNKAAAQAEELVMKGITAFRAKDFEQTQQLCQQALVELCIRSGDPEAAGKPLAAANALIEQLGTPDKQVRIVRLEAELALAAILSIFFRHIVLSNSKLGFVISSITLRI